MSPPNPPPPPLSPGETKQKKRAQKYTAEDHRRAYEVWFRTRSWRRTAEAIGSNPSVYQTVRSWSRADFACREGCPYHDWENLARQQEGQPGTSLVRPLDNPEMRHLDLVPQDECVAALEDLFASDIERLTHWEIIYAKAFYHVTGIVRLCPHLVGADGSPCTEEDLKRRFDSGLKPANLRDAVIVLARVQGEIHKLVKLSGLRRSKKRRPPSPADDAPAESRQLTIEDVRDLKELYDNTPPEKRAALAKILESELKTRQQLAGPPRA